MEKKEALILFQANYIGLAKLCFENDLISKNKRKMPADYIPEDYDTLSDLDKIEIVAKCQSSCLKLFNLYANFVAEKYNNKEGVAIVYNARGRTFDIIFDVYHNAWKEKYHSLMHPDNFIYGMMDYYKNNTGNHYNCRNVSYYIRTTNRPNPKYCILDRYYDIYDRLKWGYRSYSYHKYISIDKPIYNNRTLNSNLNNRYPFANRLNLFNEALELEDKLTHNVNLMNEYELFIDEVKQHVEEDTKYILRDGFRGYDYNFKDYEEEEEEEEEEFDDYEEEEDDYEEEPPVSGNAITGEQRENVLRRLRESRLR